MNNHSIRLCYESFVLFQLLADLFNYFFLWHMIVFFVGKNNVFICSSSFDNGLILLGGTFYDIIQN